MENNQDKKPVVLPINTMVDPVFESMLKSFLHQVKKDGIIEEVRARRYYIKPSTKRRLAKKGPKHG